LDQGVLYELPVTPNYTYKGYKGARRIPGLSASITPSNASEQKIWWYESYGDVLNCSYGWDQDGDRYIHVTAKETGTAKLYAVDWIKNGRRELFMLEGFLSRELLLTVQIKSLAWEIRKVKCFPPPVLPS